MLAFAFYVWANLLSEYGQYHHPTAEPITAVVFLALAIVLGTWLPVRRWREQRGKAGSAS
jgi:hypothetical protein